MKKKTAQLILASLLAMPAASAMAAVIGSVPACNTTNDQYTFCNSSFSASAFGSSLQIEVRFASNSFIEVLVANPVEVDLFPNIGSAQQAVFSNYTLSLLGLDGAVIAPAFEPGSLAPGNLRFESTGNVAVGTRIGGIRASIDCQQPPPSNDPDDPTPSACVANFDSLAITVDNGFVSPGNFTRSLQTGRITTVPEPTSLALVGLGLVGLARRWSRRS